MIHSLRAWEGHWWNARLTFPPLLHKALIACQKIYHWNCVMLLFCVAKCCNHCFEITLHIVHYTLVPVCFIIKPKCCRLCIDVYVYICIYTSWLQAQPPQFAVSSVCTVLWCCAPEHMQRVVVCVPHSFPQCHCPQQKQPVCIHNTINTKIIVRCNNTAYDFCFIPSHLPLFVQHPHPCAPASLHQPLSQPFLFLSSSLSPSTPLSSLCDCCAHASLLNCN